MIIGRPKLAGADVSRVALLNPQRLAELSFPEDVKALRAWCEHVGAAIVIIDPWSSFITEKESNNSDQEFRSAIGPAQRLAQQLGLAVVLVRHLKKGAAPVRERGLGSVGVGNVGRSILLAKTDPDDADDAVRFPRKARGRGTSVRRPHLGEWRGGRRSPARADPPPGTGMSSGRQP